VRLVLTRIFFCILLPQGKFLLDNGADIKQNIRLNGHYVDILTDIGGMNDDSRYMAIKEMVREKENLH
jgi:hypothetical protein